MALPEDVTPGSTAGHLTHHNELHVERNVAGASLPTSLTAGASGHLDHHSSLKGWYDNGRHIEALPAVVDAATHETAHERLHGWKNRITPPAGWESFTTVDISTADSSGSLFLRNDTNYRITDQQRTGRGIRLRGGRKVYVRGLTINVTRSTVTDWATAGEAPTTAIELDEYPTTGDYASGGSLYSGPPLSDRAFFIEGVWACGDALTQGFTMKCPTADVTLLNNRVELVQFSDCDHRDGTNGKNVNHPDLIQPYGGYKSLTVVGFTGYSGYQGMFLRTSGLTGLPTHLENVDVHAVSFTGTDGVTYYGGAMVWPAYDQASVNPTKLDNVWSQHHPNGLYKDDTAIGRRSRYWNGSSYVTETPAATAVFKDSLRLYGDRNADITTGFDSVGAYGEFTPSHVTGRVYSGNPPGGEFVPLGKAGNGYTRYGMTGPTTPPASVSFVPSITRASFDVDVDGWVGQSSTVVSRVTTPTQAGAGSLQASKTDTILRPASQFRSAPGVDWSANGDTFQAWVFIPTGAPGANHTARLEIVYYDASNVSQTVIGSSTAVPLNTWTAVRMAKGAADLAKFHRLVVQVEAPGASGSFTAYVDTVQQGSMS